MIYVCVRAHNHGSTVGLLLWKVRQVFASFPREYHLLVADDGSTDDTAEVLELYQRVLPLTVLTNQRPLGYAACVSQLLARALELTDRPRRDCAVTLLPDFTVAPEVLPELIRRIESGADLVVGESPNGPAPLLWRLVKRYQGWLLRPGLNVPGVRDFLSGCYALRLAILRQWKKERSMVLETSGWSANAELVARAAAHARQIVALTLPPGRKRKRPPAMASLAVAMDLYRAGRRLRIPAPNAAVSRAS
ncbi:MAG: hypothetical protein KatS3mg081_1151 [Gemmatimonadales bacterium]|nr:hypothetical protein HRbin33_00393 [bacterium HR33]GIW51796.1 MAG: hypothetical protein KatS3mg081_1151 [Gemmatimonadales bacterium]